MLFPVVDCDFNPPLHSVDEESIIRQYLAHPQVKRRTDQEGGIWTEAAYADAVKVFVGLKQSIASDSAPPPSVTPNDSVVDPSLSYTALCERMERWMHAFDAHKKEAYETRVAKRYETSFLFVNNRS